MEPLPEVAALRREFEALREFVETRARTQENLMRAMVAEATPRAAEALEPRIRLATREAMGFAEQGLQLHEGALRALGRRVAELSRAAAPPDSPLVAPAAAGSYAIGVATRDTRDFQRLPLRESGDDAYFADLANLPILPGGAARLMASHVIEYTPAAMLAQAILPHWRSRLAPGGELIVVTRDGPAFAAELAAQSGDFADLRRKLGADGSGRPLRLLLDPAELRELLTQAGFTPEAPTTGPDGVLRVVAKTPAT